MSGEHDESLPDPEQVVDQMREAADRLREHAWVVAAVTSTPDITDPDDTARVSA